MRQRARRFRCVTLMQMVRFLVDAIFQRDYPVVQDIHVLIALVILLGHLLVDVAYVSCNFAFGISPLSASSRVGPL